MANADDNDLLPLQEPASDESDIFAKHLSEADDAVDFLKNARAEASAPVFVPSAKSSAQPSMTYALDAADDESPAPVELVKGGLANATQANEKASAVYEVAAAHPVQRRTAEDDLLSPLDSDADPEPVEKGTTTLSVVDYALTVEGDDEMFKVEDSHLDDMLRMCQKMGGSDLHLTAGLPPMIRRDGKIIALPWEVLDDRHTQRLVYDVLSTDQIGKFELTKELDFSYGVRGLGRYRFNVYRQRGSVGCAMRVIPQMVPSLDELRLPGILRDLVRRHSGLILVTGPTGSGKSTTIASMIDIINTERQCHIMTIEDPIEYLHRHKLGMINQRELGTDTDSFGNALRAVLREDPDVILVGEMRDLETIAAAITLAETGHLVFATLHTRSAPSTVDRIIDVFPSHQQQQVRIQLSTSLEAVIAQQLLPRLGGGRVAAIEIMVATSAIRNLIREGKTHQIMSVIETGQQYGMQAMDRTLADLHRASMISYEEAVTHALDRENFQNLLKTR